MGEFEKQDQELEQLVNHAERPAVTDAPDPELEQAEAKIQKREWKLKVAEDNAREAQCRCDRLGMRQVKAMRFKAAMAMVFKVLLCAVVSLMFAITLVKPAFVAYLAHIGIVIAGAVAAIHVDRFLRQY